MSDDTSPGDKPYDPTPKKMEDARKKGENIPADVGPNALVENPGETETLAKLTCRTQDKAVTGNPLVHGAAGIRPTFQSLLI